MMRDGTSADWAIFSRAVAYRASKMFGPKRVAPASNICSALVTVLAGKVSAQAAVPAAAATVAPRRQVLARTIVRWSNDAGVGRGGWRGWRELSKRPSFLGLPAGAPSCRWVRRG